MVLHSKHNLRFLLIATYLLYLSAGNILYAQNDFRFEHLTTENGLSENVVYSICQDSKGFLWIGTHDGLNRYDGYGFKKFRYNSSDTNSLSGNSISSICEDGQGNIWLVTSGGLCRYNYDNGRFSRFVMQGSFNAQDIRQVITVNENELMIKLTHSICLLDIHTLKSTTVSLLDNGVVRDCTGISIPLSKDKKGSIYMMKNTSGIGKIWKYNNDQKRFDSYTTFPILKELLNAGVESFLIDNLSSCWFITNRNLFHGSNRKVSGNDSLTLSVIENNLADMRSLYEDNAGNLWIASRNGLLFYNKANGKINRFQHSTSANTLSSDIINVVYEDKTGIIWVGTFNGLNKLNLLGQRFRHVTANNDTHPALLNNFVLGINVGSANNSLIRYAFDQSFFSELDIQNNLIHHYNIKEYNFENYLKRVVIKNSRYLDDNTFNKLLPFLKKIKENNLQPGSLIADNKQGLWYNNVSEFMSVNTLESWPVKSLIVDMELNGDDIWLATAGDGLLCFHITSHTITRYISDELKVGSISSNDVTCFVVEDNGNMWIGTKGGGLNYFDRQKKIFQYYTEENGLCNNSIFSMVKDDGGRLWIGTSKGLSCFDPVTHKFRNYFRSNGLVNSEYNRYSACKLENGFLLMGGMNGIDYFHPDSLILMSNSIKPQVQITDFKVFNKSIYHRKFFSLGHNENYITIEFAAMDFTNPASNKFAYKLEGVDRDWVILDNRSFTTYSILSPGNYQFSVKAANNDGVWNDKPAIIEFTILTPWWRSRWFYTFCALIIIVLLYSFYRYRINQLKKVLAMRTKISQDLHDEVGATLSGIRLYSEIAKDQLQKSEKLKVQLSLEVISSNAANMTENISDIVWTVNPNNDSFSRLIQKLKGYASELTGAKNMQFYFDQKSIMPEEHLNMQQRRNLYFVCKEGINNAVKYSDAQMVTMKVFFTDHRIHIHILDDGKGFDTAKLYEGNGLLNMRARCLEIGATLLINSSINEGTKIEVVCRFS